MQASSSRGPGAAPAPGEPHGAIRGSHVVQFYEGDAFLLDQASRFIVSGFDAGEGLVVIAERAHLEDLESRLSAFGIDVAAAGAQGRYVALDAGETLAAIWVGGRLDRDRFHEVVGGAMARAAAGRSHVRAFGEMVAVLWREGRHQDALRLERFWNPLAREMSFTLLCAYPVAACGSEPGGPALIGVCGEHARVAPAESYAALATVDQRLRAVAGLQQKADALVRERAQLESERFERARLADIVDSSDDAIVGKTLEGIVTSWNEGARRIFGYTAEEMIGQPIRRLMPPDRVADMERILAQIRAGERVEHFETERVCKDGRRIHVSLTISPIRDASGKIVGASKIARDTTERKRAEEELRQHREALETISRVGLSLSAELDLEKLLQAVTDAATSLAGARYGAFFHKATDDAGERWALHAVSGAPRAAFEDAERPSRARLLEPALTGEAVVRLDDVRPDAAASERSGTGAGDVAVRSYMAVPIVGRGHDVLGALVVGDPRPRVFTDQAECLVTGLAAHAAVAIDNARLYEAERRLRSQAEASSRAKDEFLAMLGHELRNPLSSVRNAIVTASLDASRRERALGIARRGADQLVRLVDDLLDVARISRGMITLQRERVCIASIVDRAVEATRMLVEERDHRLSIVLPDGPLEVDGDQARLEQVLVNLITNAAKYTERGGHIEVRAQRRDGEAVLRVKDDGSGIASDMLPRVFDLFSQGERSLERAQGGLGIGLTVVRRLVELHGGRVEAHSAGPGKGAELVVRLPALAAPQRSEDDAFSLQQAGSDQRARVLLVEDNPDVAESMSLLLELLGHQVEMVDDGLAAIDAARTFRPDVVLIDIGLPGIDGYEVARRMREDEAIPHAMLVALTGYGRSEDKARALAAGFDHHLTKPVEFDALSALVAALPRRAARRVPPLVH
ncbi:MAG: PAS domain S-box protein [Thermodesulfobacteriota bacterium]